MQSLHQWAIGLGALGCIGLSGCGGAFDEENAAQHQAAVNTDVSSGGEAGILDIPSGVESFSSPSAQSLHPFVTCVAPGTGNELVAYFGYDNPSAVTLSVPVGPHNAFFPPPFDRGQPTAFAPGRNDNAVSVSFVARRAPLAWKLGHHRAVAGRRSPPCIPSFAGATTATVVSDSEISLAWSAATDYTTPSSDIVYDICLSTTSGSCATNFVVAQTSAAGQTLVTIAGLMANTAYVFVVRARNAVGNEDTNTVEVGAQTCLAGDVACSGACTSLATDPANCGACGNACASGLCAGGQCCSVGQELYDGACTSSLCSGKPSGAACGGDVCTMSGACESGVCVGASPVTCSPTDSCHRAGSCDPATGCSNPLATGAVCGGSDLAGATCDSATNGELPYGTLSCTPACTFDTSQCHSDQATPLVSCAGTDGVYGSCWSSVDSWGAFSAHFWEMTFQTTHQQLSPAELSSLMDAVAAIDVSTARYSTVSGTAFYSIPHASALVAHALSGRATTVDTFKDPDPTGTIPDLAHRVLTLSQDPAANEIRKYTCCDLRYLATGQ